MERELKMVAVKLSKEYLTVNGRILGEKRDGESRMRVYSHDAIGSVQAVFQAGAVKATGTYYPFWTTVDPLWHDEHAYRYAKDMALIGIEHKLKACLSLCGKEKGFMLYYA